MKGGGVARRVSGCAALVMGTVLIALAGATVGSAATLAGNEAPLVCGNAYPTAKGNEHILGFYRVKAKNVSCRKARMIASRFANWANTRSSLPGTVTASIAGFRCKYWFPTYPAGFVGAEVHDLRCSRTTELVTGYEIP